MIFKLKLWIKSRLSKFVQSLTGKACKALLIESNGESFLIPSSDISLGRNLSQGEGYNPLLRKELLSLVDNSSRVLFIGTHVGMLLIPVAKKVKEVHGFEANPDTFSLLQKNLKLNGLDNVTLHPFAASDKAGEIQFIASKDNSGGSKIFDGTDKRFEFFYDNPPIIKVPTRKVDDLVGDQEFDLILMDIEGMEPVALRGMEKTLQKAKKLVLEVHPYSFKYVSHTTPEDFFKLIPSRFNHAKPVPSLSSGSEFNRDQFLSMYNTVVAEKPTAGVDVVFSSKN